MTPTRPTRAGILATLLAAFSLATLAAPDKTAPAPGSAAVLQGPPVAAPADGRSVRPKPARAGKTRRLKSKKGKECNRTDYCE